MRRIKAAFINFWVWITPKAVISQIQTDFIQGMMNPNRKPAFASLTQPIRQRVDYAAAARDIFPIQKLDD